MRFGAFWQVPGYEGSTVAQRHWETIEEIAFAEQLGFESAWLAESVFYPTRPMSNPLMVAIAAAQRTERIRFGTLATQTPLHHPLHLASQSATCDILTQGRLELCLGGRWGTPVGQALGHAATISSEESRERVAEAVALLKAAWTEEQVTFDGKYWTTKELSVMPKPMQEPHPPLYMASNSNDTFAYAARMGLGIIATVLSQPMPRLVPRLAEFEAAQRETPLVEPQPAHVMVSFFVAKTRQEAHTMMQENWRPGDTKAGYERLKQMGFDPNTPDFATGAVGWMSWNFDRACEVAIYDEPAACVDRLQSLQEQLPGMSQCILEFNRRGRIPSPDIKASMQLFAEEVMPKLDGVSV